MGDAEWATVGVDDKRDLELLGWDEDKWNIYIDYKKNENENEDKCLKFINKTYDDLTKDQQNVVKKLKYMILEKYTRIDDDEDEDGHGDDDDDDDDDDEDGHVPDDAEFFMGLLYMDDDDARELWDKESVWINMDIIWENFTPEKKRSAAILKIDKDSWEIGELTKRRINKRYRQLTEPQKDALRILNINSDRWNKLEYYSKFYETDIGKGKEKYDELIHENDLKLFLHAHGAAINNFFVVPENITICFLENYTNVLRYSYSGIRYADKQELYKLNLLYQGLSNDSSIYYPDYICPDLSLKPSDDDDEYLFYCKEREYDDDKFCIRKLGLFNIDDLETLAGGSDDVDYGDIYAKHNMPRNCKKNMCLDTDSKPIEDYIDESFNEYNKLNEKLNILSHYLESTDKDSAKEMFLEEHRQFGKLSDKTFDQIYKIIDDKKNSLYLTMKDAPENNLLKSSECSYFNLDSILHSDNKKSSLLSEVINKISTTYHDKKVIIFLQSCRGTKDIKDIFNVCNVRNNVFDNELSRMSSLSQWRLMKNAHDDKLKFTKTNILNILKLSDVREALDLENILERKETYNFDDLCNIMKYISMDSADYGPTWDYEDDREGLSYHGNIH